MRKSLLILIFLGACCGDSHYYKTLYEECQRKGEISYEHSKLACKEIARILNGSSESNDEYENYMCKIRVGKRVLLLNANSVHDVLEALDFIGKR